MVTSNPTLEKHQPGRRYPVSQPSSKDHQIPDLTSMFIRLHESHNVIVTAMKKFGIPMASAFGEMTLRNDIGKHFHATLQTPEACMAFTMLRACS